MNSLVFGRKLLFSSSVSNVIGRNFHASSVSMSKRAGRIRQSKLRNKPISYEGAFKPERIQHQKGWLSFNTGNLHGEKNAHKMAYEDMIIRRFLTGTFYRLTTSEVVIKRRLNILEISMFVNPKGSVTKYQFLSTYTEEFLSKFLRYNVKVHLLVTTEDDMIYKYIWWKLFADKLWLGVADFMVLQGQSSHRYGNTRYTSTYDDYNWPCNDRKQWFNYMNALDLVPWYIAELYLIYLSTSHTLLTPFLT